MNSDKGYTRLIDKDKDKDKKKEQNWSQVKSFVQKFSTNTKSLPEQKGYKKF